MRQEARMQALVPYAACDDGALLAVRVVARAKRTELAGFVADAAGRPALVVRLAAPPIEGAANAALIAYIAKGLRLKQRDVVIHVGQRSRRKVLHIAGDPRSLVARLQAWMDRSA